MPTVRKIHAPRIHGRMARAKSGPTLRVTNAPTAKENAADMPT